MHFRFTDEELATLAEMLTLASWATYWNHKPGADEGVARYDDMLNKILTRMQDNGQGQMTEIDPERNRLRLRKDQEDGTFHAQCFDEMVNELFWEELTGRFTDRELVQRYGVEKLQQMTEDERKELAAPIMERYWSEFQKNGIANLHHVARLGEG